MSRMDDVINEALNRDMERDRAPEKEDKSEERIKDTIKLAVDILDKEENSRDVVIVENMARNIENNPSLSDEMKASIQENIVDIAKDNAFDKDITGQMREIELNAAIKSYQPIIEGPTKSDVDTARDMISNVLSINRDAANADRYSVCEDILDSCRQGKLSALDNNMSAQIDVINEMLKTKEDERIAKQPDIQISERTDIERQNRVDEIERDIQKAAGTIDASLLTEYRIHEFAQKIETNSLFDDKFKDLQERYAASNLASSFIKLEKSESNNIVERDTITRTDIDLLERRSMQDAFNTVLSECIADGKLDYGTAGEISGYILNKDGGVSIETEVARTAAAIDMMQKGEFREAKDIEDIFARIDKNADEKLAMKSDDRDINSEKFSSSIDNIAINLEIDGKDYDKASETVRDFDAVSLHDDSLKMEILEKAVELSKEKDYKPDEANVVERLLNDAEKQVIIEKISEGREELNLSQQRAIEYLEKNIAREDLTAQEKSAHNAAILSAYEKGVIPDREDLSRRAERAVAHNIEMDSKDRILDFKDKELVSRDADGGLKDKYNIKEEHIEILNAGLLKIDRLADESMKDLNKESFAKLISERQDELEKNNTTPEKLFSEAQTEVLFDKFNLKDKDLVETKNMKAVVKSVNENGGGIEVVYKSLENAFNLLEKGEIPKDKEIDEKEAERFSIRASADVLEKMQNEKPAVDAAKQDKKADDTKNIEPNKNRNDDKDKSKERPIGVDPEKDAREEAKVSKKAWHEEAKEIWEKSAEIYDRKVLSANHNTDTTLSQQERDIVQRSIKLRQEQMDKNNAEKTQLIEKNIKLQRAGQEVPKEIIERLGKLEKYNQASEREIYKMKQMVDPEYIKARELSRPRGETKEHMKQELEAKTIYPDPSNSKIFHFREEALHWRHHPGIMERVTYEACLYSGLTGRTPSSIAGKDISTFEVRNNNLPTLCFQRAMQEFRHSEGARMYLEIFKVDGRKAKPMEINNVCAVLDKINKSDADEKTKALQRVAVADLCRDGKIGNVKANEEYRNNLYEKAVKTASERKMAKDPIKEGLEREEKKDVLRETLSKNPEKTDREIVKYVLAAKDKVDMQVLEDISREAKDTLYERAPVDKDGNKNPAHMEEYQLSKQEMRQIVCGANPEMLSKFSVSVKMPEGVELNREMYDRAVEVIRGTNEKNEVVKMALVNFALSPDGSYRGLDGEEGKHLDAISKRSEMLVKSLADMDAKHEIVKVIRQDLRDTIAKEKEIEREEARKEIRPTNYDRSPEKILRDTSRAIGNICRSDDYDRAKLEAKLAEVREGMRYHRQELSEDFKSIRTKDRGLKPNDAIAVVERDPRMLLSIQRAGISIGMNGLINEERLNETIMKMEMIPRENTVLRMAILEKNFIESKNNGMNLKNAINLGTSEATRDANNMALWLYARDNGIKYREPWANLDKDKEKALRDNDIKTLQRCERMERERDALNKNIADLRAAESRERLEKAFVSNLSALRGNRALERAGTFTNLQKDLSPVAALAVRSDYEERLNYFISGLKARNDADSDNVKESIKILETLSRMTDGSRADSASEKSILNRSYDSDGKAIDVNLEARLVALRAVEKIYGIENNTIMDKTAIARLNNHNVAAQYEDMRNNIDEKAKRIYFAFKNGNLPAPAQTDSIREYINRNGYDSKLKLNDRPNDEVDKKVGFLVDMGYGKEIAGGKDINGISYLYTKDNLEKIDTLYGNVLSKVDMLRDNYAPDGKESAKRQKEHISASYNIASEAERTARIYQDARSVAVVNKDRIPAMMIDVERRNLLIEKEEGLKNVPMYNGAMNVAVLSDGTHTDRMLFAKNPVFYPLPIDKVRPSIEIKPYAINAGDLKTIMDNREKLVDSGVQYTIDYSRGYDKPMFSASGLNDISVSNLSDDLYKAITRGCSAENFKEISEMRHDSEIYKIAKDGATAYQKYYADFNRSIAKTPEQYDRNVKELRRYFEIIKDARDAVAAYNDPSVDINDKVSVYMAIEYSRQELFDLADDKALYDAYRQWQFDTQEIGITPEHSAKERFDAVTAMDEPQVEIDKSPFDMAMELAERIGYSVEDAFAFMDAYDRGDMTEEEFNFASLNYNIFKDVQEQEYLAEYGQANGFDSIPNSAEYEAMMEEQERLQREAEINAMLAENHQFDNVPDENYFENPEPEMDYYNRNDDDTRMAYTDSDSMNTPFAGLFNNFDFGFNRDEVPVMGEDELDYRGGQDLYDSGMAYFEQDRGFIDIPPELEEPEISESDIPEDVRQRIIESYENLN